MMDRWVEKGLLDVLGKEGVGSIAFSPLEQGLLTDKYLHGLPEDSRAVKDGRYLNKEKITPELIEKIKELNQIARGRGQSLAQMAVAWLLKDPRITTVLVGASSSKQLLESIGSLQNLDFSAEELSNIERVLG
jgi:L-glyceraldehyde 3-phosphate reductase